MVCHDEAAVDNGRGSSLHRHLRSTGVLPRSAGAAPGGVSGPTLRAEPASLAISRHKPSMI